MPAKMFFRSEKRLNRPKTPASAFKCLVNTEGEYQYKWSGPVEKGIYRIEVRLRLNGEVPWIYSNLNSGGPNIDDHIFLRRTWSIVAIRMSQTAWIVTVCFRT
jgi:hypothetical protein